MGDWQLILDPGVLPRRPRLRRRHPSRSSSSSSSSWTPPPPRLPPPPRDPMLDDPLELLADARGAVATAVSKCPSEPLEVLWFPIRSPPPPPPRSMFPADAPRFPPRSILRLKHRLGHRLSLPSCRDRPLPIAPGCLAFPGFGVHSVDAMTSNRREHFLRTYLAVALFE